MEPFASPDQLDPKLRSFLEEASGKLCNWFAETGDAAPLPTSSYLPDIPPSLEGLSNEALLKDIQILMNGAYRPSHPGSLAHLDPPPLTSSIVADLVSAGLNNNLLANELSPGFTKLEKKVCDWIAHRIGMSSGSGGVLASGGTISNLMALVLARKQANLQSNPNVVILASSDAHTSLLKAVGIMGLSPNSLRRVSTNEEGQILVDTLFDELKQLRANGLKCFAVVATAGTTIRGAIDPLKEIAEFCLREDIWFHIDGAIGGVFGLIKDTSHLVDGISLANSVSINPQKILGVAKTSSLLLVANRTELNSCFGTDIPYLEPVVGDDFHGGEIGIQGTRPADIFKLWLGLRQLGDKGIQLLLEQAIERREYLQKHIDASKFFIASGPLHLIALTPKNADKSISYSWSNTTRQHLLDQNFMVSRPFYNGKYYLKVVLGNPHTQFSHLDKLAMLINQSVNS